jgi:hypothetical protein
MPAELALKFEAEFDLSADTIKESIYRKENPNTYLAQFAKFIIENKEVPEMKVIINDGLQRFISHQIFQFVDAKEIPIHFIGSIAFHLKEELNEILTKNGLSLGNVIKRPIDGIVAYHKELLDTSYL